MEVGHRKDLGEPRPVNPVAAVPIVLALGGAALIGFNDDIHLRIGGALVEGLALGTLFRTAPRDLEA